MKNHLSRNEREELEELVEIITENLTSFVKAGWALMKIRDKRLYRETHDTFEKFCRERWDMSASRARQLIGAAHVIEVIASVTPRNTPETEYQTRPLVGMPEEQQVDAWQTASRNGTHSPTSAEVARSAASVEYLAGLSAPEQMEEVKRQEAGVMRADRKLDQKHAAEKGLAKLRAAKKEYATIDGPKAVRMVKALDRLIAVAEEF